MADDYSAFESSAPRGGTRRDSTDQEPDSPYAGFQRVTGTSAVMDTAEQLLWGFTRGFDNLLHMPGDLLVRAPLHMLGLGEYAPTRVRGLSQINPGGALHGALPFTSRTEDAPRTAAGEYGRSVGEALGASVLPTGALVRGSQALASLTPTTVPRAIGQTIGARVAANPTAAVGADIVASTGAGLAQEAAADAGAGPLAQAYAGVAGAFAPTALGATVGGLRRGLATARASGDPYARIAAGLGDTSVDDLATATAVGTTRQDAGINRRVLDILGEEMLAANGNRGVARDATIARIEAELAEENATALARGVQTPPWPNPAQTARDRFNRLLEVNAGNNLMLGEFPAVTAGNMATRAITPYAPRGATGRRLLDVWQEEFTRAGGNVAAAEDATIDRLVASGVRRSDAVAAMGRLRARRPTDQELGVTTEPGTQQLIDMVANAGSMASSQGVRTAVTQRAANLGQRLLDLVRNLSPGGRSIRDVEDMLANLRRRWGAEYDAVHSTPGAVNQGALYAGMQRVIDRHLARLRGRGGEVADELRKAMDSFYVAESQGVAAGQAAQQRPNALAARMSLPLLTEDLAAARLALREARRQRVGRTQIAQMSREVDDLVERIRVARRDTAVPKDRSLPTSLRVIQDARSDLYGKIQQLAREGNTAKVGVLRSFYNDVTAAMERASPRWAAVNRRWADMRLEEMAAQLGESFTTRAGPQLRRQLREFQQLAPEAQDVVRVHFVQRLLDEIEHEIRQSGQTNLAKLFDREDKRNLIRAILGDEAGNAIARVVRDANVMARTTAGIHGSQTHLRGQVQREQDVDLQAIASAAQFDWRNWRAAAFERVLGIIRERRNRTLGRALTTPMRDVPGVAEQIERMRQATDRVTAASAPRPTQVPILGGILPAINRLMGR